MADASKQEIKLFYCYSHEDKALRDTLEKYLSSLKRLYLLRNWHDREILPGEEWAQTIDTHLNTAHLILLLVSPDFMNSEYCYGKEMQRALARHKEGTCKVIPIILRPTFLDAAPFNKLQMLPTDAKPITRWSDRDEAFEDVIRGISRAIIEILTNLEEKDRLHESRIRHEVEELKRNIAEYTKSATQLENEVKEIQKAHQIEVEQYQSHLRELMNELNQKQQALQGMNKQYEELTTTLTPTNTPEKEFNPKQHDSDRLKKGLRTPEEAFVQPILKTLNELGGSAKTNDVLERVEQSMKKILKPVDYEQLASRSKMTRWRNTAQWARDTMVKEGLLLSNSPHGIWEISEDGRMFLKDKASHLSV
jgi:Mrr N-terminal domain/TIR domain